MKKNAGFRLAAVGFVILVLTLGSAVSAQAPEAVNLILKNDSSADVEVALVDRYGGNFTATVPAGTSQNQTLKMNSEIKIAECVVHVAAPEDEGKEIVIAGQ